MEHYITLFDGNFLPQGLALHASLQKHAPSSLLWVVCMDQRAQRVLERLNLAGLQIIPLQEVEQKFPELLTVKAGRTRAEYCWTLTPFTPRLVFDRDSTALRATYVDADVFFLRNPAVLFDELDVSGKAVQITEHAYDPVFDQSSQSGRFCVQFITFTRERGEPVRQWWQERCVEWCFARHEPGRFGDQKYLDDWPERFAGLVHVLNRRESLQAPWNARRFPYSEAVAWHFHGLRLLGANRVLLYSNYEVPEVAVSAVYEPYARLLLELAKQHGAEKPQAVLPWLLGAWAKSLVKSLLAGALSLRGRYRIKSF